ncbi:peptide ABC transporter substrate-binding protein [Mycoplasma sp. CSL10137]|uniref:ABC transporter substrate-binding protein n=1 Tax=Mycoplasma sp. CSL10137 TaxID=2813824 RepID=UPI00197B8AC8|nr:ABC transporter substrate-binding protein [Mycoplasma sp. CSL10137]MBN4083367.1 peptide ABC transporter substrate-binding protein [Mycoplasma sp. CSL10137]
MKNKKIKKSIFYLGSIISFGSITAIVSCSMQNNDNEQINKNNLINYDFGLTAEPINNLNYIKYKSIDKILPSLVDSYLKTGPNTTLKSVITTNKFNFVMVDSSNTIDVDGNISSKYSDFIKNNKNSLEEESGFGRVQGTWYSIDEFQIVGGLGSATVGDPRTNATLYGFRNPKNSNNFMAITGRVNAKRNRWSNNDFVTANDIRDYLEYILDLNTGSQKLDEIKKYGIRGTDRFIEAQKNYIQKFNKSYLNPWGRRKYILDKSSNTYIQDPNQNIWQPQVFNDKNEPLDLKEVEEIKNASLDFGFYTGQLFLDYTNEEISENLIYNIHQENQKNNFDLNKEIQDFKFMDKNTNTLITKKIIKNPFVNPDQIFNLEGESILAKIKSISSDENSFSMIFDENKTPSLNFLLSNILNGLFPVNRKYIETIAGGIDKYGSDTNIFLTSGPFLMDRNNILLGPQGYINLVKNNDYFDADNTISNKIKIYLSTDKNTNSTLFEDGFVSQTYIPANKINEYWTNPEYKDYLNKNQGYGTIGFGFNLDSETNGESYLNDQDLRNAIYYAIDREKILKMVGWDFSFPVSTWTAYGQYKTFDGKNIENYFSDLSMNTKPDANGEGSKEMSLQNYDFVVHLAKGFTFEKTRRSDIAHNETVAKIYLERFKKKYPNLKDVTLRFLNNSTDEQKKAGTFLSTELNRVFDGFIKIENKSLPENAFASWIEEGKYDIIYQNYDKLGGNGAQDYVSVFFKPDEVDSSIQKRIAFKDNPVGSFTYSTYISQLVLDKLNINKGELLKNLLNELFNFATKQSQFKNEFNKIKKSQKFVDVSSLATKLSNDFKDSSFSNQLLKYAFEFLLINNPKIKNNRLNHLAELFIFEKYGVNGIEKLTLDTKKRLNIQQSLKDKSDTSSIDFWSKFIELSFLKKDETFAQYTDRLNAFFSANFTNEEVKQKWTQEYVYVFIGELEKIVRDSAPVIPLMEVDTNWEITRIGGVDSLFRFSLQYAYDFTRPPRPGLPRKRGQ